MTSEGTTRVAVYERTIAASLARIWENVLDWEHLPWLHRSSFGGVRLLDESPAGWRAWITTRPRADESLVAVEIDRPARRYVTRTTDGTGAGSAIWTTLEPQGARATRIRVEFEVPLADPSLADGIGAGYVRLYTRLWDEDEAMMIRRQRLLDGESVGSLRSFEVGGEIVTYPTICPHLGGPLEDAVVEDGCVVCPWHGYRYDVASGSETSGRGRSLMAVKG